LAVLLGRNAARLEYAMLMAIAYATPFVLWLGYKFDPWVLLPLLSLPLAVRLTRTVNTIEGPALNRALGGTAQLLALYGVLLSLGLIV